MAYPPPLAELIKQRLPLEELVGEYVQLVQRGSRLFGLCPFHEEKTPSFTVNPDGQFYYCFGCRKTGDILSFYMTIKGLSFREAIEELARRVGLENGLPKAWDQDQAQSRQDWDCLKAVQAFYSACLAHPRIGEGARRYLEDRGLSKETQEKFCLGFAPRDPKGIVSTLERAEIPLEQAVEVGVLQPADTGGYRDPLGMRVVFPILDERGRVIGFGGRAFLPNQAPKYLNTKESRLFKKGHTLYGLSFADEAIRKLGSVFVVEGYIDVLAMFQAGFSNVVATLGVELSKDHIQKLSKKATNICLLFDGDKAGVAALVRAFALLVEMGIWGYALALPDGHDPDSYLRAYGKEGFERHATNRVPLVDLYVLERLKTLGSSLEGRAALVREFHRLLEACPEPMYRAFLWERFKEQFGLVLPGVAPRLKSNQKGQSNEPKGEVSLRPEPFSLVLAFLIQFPKYIPKFRPFSHFLKRGGDHRLVRVWEAMERLSLPEDQGPLWQNLRELPEVRASGPYLTGFVNALEAFAYSSLSQASADGVFEELLSRVRAKVLMGMSMELNLKIREAEQKGEVAALKTLLIRKKAIVEALKRGGSALDESLDAFC
jgi:DNA primase